MPRQSKRRRLTAAPSPTVSNGQIWLDLLPDEISHLVIQQVAFYHADHVLSLALSSSHQAECVNHNVYADLHHADHDVSLHRRKDWHAVVGRHIRHVALGSWLEADSSVIARHVDLVKRPNVQKVTICTNETWLNAIRGSTSIRSLVLDSVSTSNVSATLANLKSLKLEELSIRYAGSPVFCLLDKIYNMAPTALASHCKHVRKLHIDCLRIETFKLMEIIQAFPVLREVSLTRGIGSLAGSPTDVLYRLEKVHLREVTALDLQEIGSLGSRLETLCVGPFQVGRKFLFAADVRQLSKCVGLRVLRTDIAPGAEQVFMSLPFVENLRILELKYIHGRTGDWYYRPAQRVLFSIVSRAHSLAELFLYNVSLSRGEIEDILKLKGLGLHSFGFSVTGLHKSAISLVLFLLKVLATHNGCLRELKFQYMIDQVNGSPRTSFVPSNEELPQLSRAVELLRRRTKISQSAHIRLCEQFTNQVLARAKW